MPFCGRIDETIPNCLIVLVAASLTEMEQTVDEQLHFFFYGRATALWFFGADGQHRWT